MDRNEAYLQQELHKLYSVIKKALKGDVLAIMELAVRVNPATLAIIMAGDFAFGTGSGEGF